MWTKFLLGFEHCENYPCQFTCNIKNRLLARQGILCPLFSTVDVDVSQFWHKLHGWGSHTAYESKDIDSLFCDVFACPFKQRRNFSQKISMEEKLSDASRKGEPSMKPIYSAEMVSHVFELSNEEGKFAASLFGRNNVLHILYVYSFENSGSFKRNDFKKKSASALILEPPFLKYCILSRGRDKR